MFERIVVPLPDFVIDGIWTRIVKANQDVIRKFHESAKQVKELGWPESKIDLFSDKNTFKNIIDTGSTIPDTEINYQKCLKGADTKPANKKSYADEVIVKVSKWMENELGVIRNLTSNVTVPEVEISKISDFNEYPIKTITDNEKSSTLGDYEYYDY